MNVVFTIPGTDARTKKWDGRSIRSGGVGVSGTEQSGVLFAEHLARQGHTVTMH